MDGEKREFGAWWIWILFLIVISIPVIWGLNAAGLIGHTIVERKVFEESYQKKAGDRARLNTYRASEAMLLRRLQDTTLTEGQRANLQSQLDAVRIRINSTEGN